MIFNTVVLGGGSGSSYTVTVSLTNPQNPYSFSSCEIYEREAGGNLESIGIIESASGNSTVTVSKPYLLVQVEGASVYGGTVSCTGGVSYVSEDYASWLFNVTGDGAVTIDGVNYDD